ncbi:MULTISPECIES: helix-turn-helix domain-containing protein [Ensifer]|jgi:chromosomal replication initiation ATPase DnaA|nr:MULTISPECIES: helix-turn-helix domain-containing protein [Ensifer]MDP9627992.1 chromosomal replication initiation ATPase DnaA [Ensifer adhaerens]
MSFIEADGRNEFSSGTVHHLKTAALTAGQVAAVKRGQGGAREMSTRLTCRLVQNLTAEAVHLAADRIPLLRDRRRAKCHVRQIAMYVCHVVLQISQGDIANAFERDRTTVRHACSVIEDRRDAADFDAFIETIERLVSSAFTAQAERGE